MSRTDSFVFQCRTPLAGASLTPAEAVELEQVFRLLADRHRLTIINMLARAGGEAVCVCEFQATLQIAQPTVSYHLKQLTAAGLLERERRASFVYYRLRDGVLERLAALLAPSPASAEAL